MATKITVKAPSSTANLGPGFDVFGLAVDAFYDTVTLTKTDQQEGITIISDDEIPTDPKRNTAGLVARNMREEFGIREGVEVEINKGVPPGFGMGSSAASAAATAVAFNRLFGLRLSRNALVEFAGVGEQASAGTIHYDNVAASVLGGFVIVKTDPLDVIRIRPPSDLRMCIAVPTIQVPKKKTEMSRSLIPKKIRLKDSVVNLSNASTMIVGFMTKDSQLIGNSIKDRIVEPARQRMIPGFARVKEGALKAGALGVTISGAGPSVIAFSDGSANMRRISSAMGRGFAAVDVQSRRIICSPSDGARVV